MKEINKKNGEITCKMDAGDISLYFMTSQFYLLSWGYFKIIIDIFLLFSTPNALYDTFCPCYYFELRGTLIVTVLANLIFADVFFNGRLVYGLHKSKLKDLSAYCTYTKVLWILLILLSAVYAILRVTGILWEILFHMDCPTLSTIIHTMLFSVLFQTFLMPVVIYQYKKHAGGSLSIRVFNYTVTVESKSSEKEEDSNNQHSEETSDQTKLPV